MNVATEDDLLASNSGGPDGVTIRTATGDDLDAVVEVGHRTWPPTYEPIAGADYVAMGLAKWWTPDAVIPSIRAGRTVVAEVDGLVSGIAVYGSLDEDLALWKLYVLPEAQGRRIGSRLMDEVVRRALDTGYTRIFLSHLAGNDSAAGFYTRHGFTQTHVEEGGSGLPDSIWMAKDLVGHLAKEPVSETQPGGIIDADTKDQT